MPEPIRACNLNSGQPTRKAEKHNNTSNKFFRLAKPTNKSNRTFLTPQSPIITISSDLNQEKKELKGTRKRRGGKGGGYQEGKLNLRCKTS